MKLKEEEGEARPPEARVEAPVSPEGVPEAPGARQEEGRRVRVPLRRPHACNCCSCVLDRKYGLKD